MAYLLAPCALWEPAPADCTPRQIVPLALGSVVAIWFVGFILSGLLIRWRVPEQLTPVEKIWRTRRHRTQDAIGFICCGLCCLFGWYAGSVFLATGVVLDVWFAASALSLLVLFLLPTALGVLRALVLWLAQRTPAMDIFLLLFPGILLNHPETHHNPFRSLLAWLPHRSRQEKVADEALLSALEGAEEEARADLEAEMLYPHPVSEPMSEDVEKAVAAGTVDSLFV